VSLFESGGEHIDATSLAIALEIDPRHEPIAREHGQTVVAIDTVLGRFVDFQHLVEAKERGNSIPIPQDWIEGRKKYASIAARTGTVQAGRKIEILPANPTIGAVTGIIPQPAR